MSEYCIIEDWNDLNLPMSHNPENDREAAHEPRTDDLLTSDGVFAPQGIFGLWDQTRRRAIGELFLVHGSISPHGLAQLAYRESTRLTILLLPYRLRHRRSRIDAAGALQPYHR